MPRGRREPVWLTSQIITAIHDRQLASHGGRRGLRDPGALESAIGRPRHRWHYREAEDLADCAAAYGFGLTQNLAFTDGNKRTAFVSMATFYQLNGRMLTASEVDAVLVMVGVAEGSISEQELAGWLRERSEEVGG